MCFAQLIPEPAPVQSPDLPQTVGNDTTLVLEVTLNGVALGLIAEFGIAGDRLWIAPDQYAGLGFQPDPALVTDDPDGGSRVYLDSVPGLSWQVDARAQTIALIAQPASLRPVEIRLAPPAPHIDSQANWGAMLGYDLYGQWSTGRNDAAGGSSVSVDLDMRIFSPWFTLSSTGFADLVGGTGQFVRLDTSLTFDDPASARRLTIGDAITDGPGWVRPFRFGGVQWMTDFALRPDLVTMPMPTLSADVAVPSAVDLYVDGVRRYSESVAPGPLRMEDLPVVAGANRLRMVVTDRAGRRTEVVLPFYSAPTLLAPGLTSFALDAGTARRDYASESNRYSGAFASASVAHGASGAATMHGYAAVADGYAGGAIGLSALVADLLLLDTAVLYSVAPKRRGLGWHLGLEHVSDGFHVGASYVWTGGYTDLAELFGSQRLVEQISASAGVSLGRLGRIDLAYVAQHQEAAPTTRIASGTWGTDLFHKRLHLGVSGYHELDFGDWGVSLSLSLQLGSSAQAGVTRNWGRDQQRTLVQLSGTGFGQRLHWEAEAEAGDFDRFSARADWQGQLADLSFHAERAEDETGIDGRVRQSLVLLDGDLFLTNAIDDGFAVVDVENTAGVRVALENRPVGRTGRDGRLIVTGLQSYTPNALSIDALDLPADAEIDGTVIRVAPRADAGAIVRFAVRRARSAILVLQRPDGGAPPIGATVTVSGMPESGMVGHGGEAYLRGLAAGGNRAEVAWPDGGCTALFTMPDVDGELPRIGPITCAP